MIRTKLIVITCTLAALWINTEAGQITIDGSHVGAGVADALPHSGSPESVVAAGFTLDILAQGVELLENPSGIITRFGFLSDAASTKTEPDENTYLVLDHNPGGPTLGYDYGRHFLLQGHENANNLAYVTRINLDVVNPDHRITLLTPPGNNGLTGFNSIDGSCWNPFSKTLLFTQEAGSTGGVIEMEADFDAATGTGAGLRTLYGSIGRGGFEGIHPDDWGNLLIAEDAGGTTDAASNGRNPNSFIFRFVPTNPSDLTQGVLQALQVSINGAPVKFVAVDANHPTGDIFGDNQLQLHTPGTSWPVTWVTVHDTAVDGTTSFNANALAKAAGATPFKRPENIAFKPGSKFQTFFFDPTGDTDSKARNNPDLAARGSWGSIFRVDLAPDRNSGTISICVLGDADHASFDNLTFASDEMLLATEDRGDMLHGQLNKLDSIWAFDVSKHPAAPARLVALGRDRLSAGVEDNEPTGLLYSDGDSSIGGLLGSHKIKPAEGLLFFTMQHGENNLYLVQPSGHSQD